MSQDNFDAEITLELEAKKNEDESYSTSIKAGDLIKYARVDFYREDEEDELKMGYQRNETLRGNRGRQIEKYISRCIETNNKPALFEMTANARLSTDEKDFNLDSLDFKPTGKSIKIGTLGLPLDPKEARFLSMIDGGTRLLGIKNAVSSGIISDSMEFDIRIFIDLTVPKEIIHFLLINDTQKKVRTDLGVRVVGRLRDSNKLKNSEIDIVKTVVPDTESWKFNAAGIVSNLNTKYKDGPWHNKIQMPGEISKRIALQAFFTSLQPLLENKEIDYEIKKRIETQKLRLDGELLQDPDKDKLKFIEIILKNFWNAVKEINPDAEAERKTNVLWAPIGVNSHHIALTKTLVTLMGRDQWNFSLDHFKNYLKGSLTENYDYWYSSRPLKNTDTDQDERLKPKTNEPYPANLGPGRDMTGRANYGKVADRLYNGSEHNGASCIGWIENIITKSSEEEINISS